MIPANLSKSDFNRICILGTSCSGKTKLANELSSILNIPHIELDHLFWKPNWQKTSPEKFYKMVEKITSSSQWIIDGNYSRVSELTWDRATVIIWLNYSFPRIFIQGLNRTLRRVILQESLFSGNRETFWQSFFSKDSILWWIIYSYPRIKRRYRDVFNLVKYRQKTAIQLKSPVEKNYFYTGSRYIIHQNKPVVRKLTFYNNHRMKKAVLNRYELSAEEKIIIDVSASRIEDLYNDFDKSAPYIRRDLDQDLVDYLIDCTREVGSCPFVIRFTLSQSPDEEKQSRIKRSVYNFFHYLGVREKQNLLQKFRKSAILFIIGLVILFVAVSVNKILGDNRTVIMNVMIQGLTVAAWVSLWEAIAIFLIEWLPLKKRINLYLRVAKSPVIFRSQKNKI